MNWYISEGENIHPVERAAILHAVFVGSHPFFDGNGRIARLSLNLELRKEGFPPVIIEMENRLVYYEVLDKAHMEKDYGDFIRLVASEVEDFLLILIK